ncbi:MAG: hypothetical protein FWE76_07110, partial [Symbiobacteriaceae bacterium]|nr:hypothetical protein [Symbiobacteriaceae bacterium]
MTSNPENERETALQVRRAARHFAMLYFNLCRVLVEKCGEETALPVIQKVIFKLSLDRTDRNRCRALQAGASLDLESFNSFNDLPTIGWSAWEESMGGVRCPYAEQWLTYYEKYP